MSPPSLPDLIAARAALAGITPSAEQVDQLVAYYRLLDRWNQRVNLTGLPLSTRESPAIDRLLIEPLIASVDIDELPFTWFDFGSGGGSPAIPLKIMRPRSQLFMVEAKARKGAFLREAVSSLGLRNATVITGRIEDVAAPDSLGTADMVTIRAVRIDPEVLAAAYGVLKVHARLLVFRGAGTDSPRLVGFALANERTLVPSSGILSTFDRLNG